MKSLKRGLKSERQNDSISSKIFLRSTRAGKIQKIVSEVYLRNDIPCSSQLCSVCPATAPADSTGTTPKPVLSSKPSTTKAFPEGHYLVPDTNALLNGMDLFEQPDAFFDVIILQTVLEELKNRSLPIYNRLLALTRSPDKRYCLFFNEFRSETHVRRQQGETINDRNDRAIRTAARWYTDHLPKKKRPAIVVLTDDRANLEKAEAENVTALRLADYVAGLEDADRLLDMITASRESGPRNKGELFYPEYYSNSKILTGTKAGVLHQGIFHVSPYNYLEGSVQVAAFEKPLLILGRENSNRSVSGDSVVVEILPKDQWKAPSTKIIDEDTLNKNDDPENEDQSGITDRERKLLYEEVKRVHGEKSEANHQPTARVVGVVKRNWRQYVGTVDPSSTTSRVSQGRQQQTIFLLPMDKKIPKIRIRTRQADDLIGKRVLATIDSWDRDTRYPVGHYVRSLGDLETKGAETEALLLEYDVQYRPFPKTVLDCLPSEGHDWKVPSPLPSGRTDLRHLSVCSIDPPNCQDIDDALHARPLPNGNIEVGVHIADVSHFVKPGTAMDQEAAVRGTTVYLVDKRIDMLPMLLGTDLCSLKPYVERYAFSTIWELTPDAQVVSAKFMKSVILSKEAFSYEQAQLRIDDASAKDPLTASMRTLLSLSKILRANRMTAGALNLSSPEVRIETDSETSDPLADVKTKASLATNSLVEEFMLLANITVAQRIQSAFPLTALLRRHASPPASNFTTLTHQLETVLNFSLDVSSSLALATTLDDCVSADHPFLNTLIRILATRCMTSAEYFFASAHAQPEYRHYGLATPIYTHFTSPIRRYADLLVHRQLAHAIDYTDETSGSQADAALRNKDHLESLCRNLNYRHRNAQMAGRASIEFYVGQALKATGGQSSVETDKPKMKTSAKTKKSSSSSSSSPGVEAEGYIMRVFDNGAVVFVPRFGIEGLVRLEDFQLLNQSVTDADTDADADALSVSESQQRVRESDFDAENYTLRVWAKSSGHGEGKGLGSGWGEVQVRLFDAVKVRVSSEEKAGQREMGKRRVRIVVLR